MSKPRKYATTTEATIRTLVAQGLTNGQIAEKLNLSPTALYTARSVLGIVSPAKREAFGVKPWWLPAMAAGATVDTICKAEGVSYTTVYGALKRAGLPTTRKDAAEYMAGHAKNPLPDTGASNQGPAAEPLAPLAQAA